MQSAILALHHFTLPFLLQIWNLCRLLLPISRSLHFPRIFIIITYLCFHHCHLQRSICPCIASPSISVPASSDQLVILLVTTMSVLGKRRSRKSSPQHAFPPRHLSSSFSKLRRFINDIKTKHAAHRDMVVKVMGTSAFAFFPVSQAPPMPSPCKPSAKLVQSIVSIPIVPKKIPTPADSDRTEISTAHACVAAKQLRHAFTNRQRTGGAKFTMLALLVLGFLWAGKAAAVCITVIAYLLLRIGMKLGSLGFSFRQSHPGSDFGSDSSPRGDIANDFDDLQGIQKPVSPSTTSVGSPCCLDRSTFPEHPDPNQGSRELLSHCCWQETSVERQKICARIKLGTLLLVVLFGLLQGRLAAVFVATCSILALSKVQAATQVLIRVTKSTFLPSIFRQIGDDAFL